MKKLTLLLVASVFLGAQILALDVGVASLSIYRLVLLVITSFSLFHIIQNNPNISFSFDLRTNQYRFVYIIWLLYALLSVIWVQSLSGWIKGVFFVACGIISIIFIGFYMKNEKDMKHLYWVLFIMIGMHQLIGWGEIVFNKYLWADMGKIDRYGTFATNASTRVPITTFANRNDYATLMLAGVAISFIIFFNTKYLKVKVIGLVSIISSIYMIYRSLSRANILGLVIFIGILILTKIINLEFMQKSVKYISLLVISGIILVLLIPITREIIFQLVDSALQGTFAENSSNRTRLHLIINGFIFLAQTIGFGVGAGNIEYWMDNYRVLSTGGVEGDIVNMHNWFMEILTAYGIIVFVLYVLMYIIIIRRLYLNFRFSNNSFIRKTSWILLAYLGAFLMSSTSSASNIFIEWQWIFWGVIIAFVQYSESHSKTKKNQLIDSYY